MVNFMKESMVMIEDLSKVGQNFNKMNQIVFILSDGRFNKDVINNYLNKYIGC
jgi:hypothetical protein